MSENGNQHNNNTPPDPMVAMQSMMQAMFEKLLQANKAETKVVDENASARKAFKAAGFVTEVKGAGTRYQKRVKTASMSATELVQLLQDVPGIQNAITSVYVTLKDEFDVE